MKAEYSCKIKPAKKIILKSKKFTVSGRIHTVRNFYKDSNGKIVDGDISFSLFVPDK